MDIENIEKNIGSLSADPNMVLKEILFISIRNQSFLEAIIAVQVAILKNNPEEADTYYLNVLSEIQKREVELVAEIVSRIGS